MTLPGDLPTDLITGDTFTAAEENTVGSTVNTVIDVIETDFRRPARNTIAAVGDSITALGSYGQYPPWLGFSTYYQLPLLTHQRIRYSDGGMYAVSGSLIQAQHDTQLPQVLAMNPLPGACILCVNTGSIANDPDYSFATSASLTESMVASCLAAGVIPILWTVTPIISGTAFTPTQIAASTQQWNTWIRRYAGLNGLPVIDAFNALAQVDGTPMSGVLRDTIHPNDVGHQLIAEQALADGLADIFPPNSLVNTSRSTADLTNLFNNGTINLGLFTTDVTTAGIGDGLLKVGGTGAFALVAPAANEELMGNWQQMTATSGNSASLTGALTTGWSVGDTIAFSARYKTSGVVASAGGLYYVSLYSATPGGYTTPDGTITGATYLFQGVYQGGHDVTDSEIYVEYQIPSAVTSLAINLAISGVTSGSAVLSVGEVTVRNLTTGGLLI